MQESFSTIQLESFLSFEIRAVLAIIRKEMGMTHFHIFTCVYECSNSFDGDEPFTVLRPSTSAYLTFTQNAVVTQDVYLFSLDYFHRRCFLLICGRTFLSLLFCFLLQAPRAKQKNAYRLFRDSSRFVSSILLTNFLDIVILKLNKLLNYKST